MDYSAGVDISNYKNIFVPTSYMAVNSKYDFEGGYENDTKAECCTWQTTTYRPERSSGHGATATSDAHGTAT